MERQVKIFIVVTLVFVMLAGLAMYSAWFKKEKDNANIAVLDPKDPLLIKAKDQAKATLDTLQILFPRYEESSYIRFPYKFKGAEIHLWADLTEIAPDHANATIKPGPYAPGFVQGTEEVQMAISRVEDWLVELEDGRIRGGFTTQALLMSQMQKPNANTDSLELLLSNFVDRF